jgi:alpha-L-fucosidase
MSRSIYILFLLGPSFLWAQKPSPAQLEWHATEFYFFLHFGPNTFTDMEWGLGTETEDMFNPTHLDCDQWCTVAKSAGAKGLIITAKHHDGFCLWPSAFSKHTVRESKWKDGKGDVLRELSDACKRHGLKLGLYLSPWDRNHPKYGTSEYNDIYVKTMTELMTQYGNLFEFWWDGANGEGPNGKRQVYDFHRFEKEAAKMQPNAVIFSDIGPGCRWAGNEQGTIGETNWCMLDTAGFKRGEGGPPTDTLQTGNYNGKNWIPAECDVSIRPGWFYHEAEDSKVKTPEQIWSIYLKSVGHGANLILNVPPDRTGRIHPIDSAYLAEFGRLKAQRTKDNLVKSSMLGGQKQVGAVVLLDRNPSTFIRMPKQKHLQYIDLELSSSGVNRLFKVQEYLGEGQFVSAFEVQGYDKTTLKWISLYKGTTIGARRWIPLPDDFKTDRLRMVILGTRKGVRAKISEIAVFR